MKVLSLDTFLAWRRVKADLQERNFVNTSLYHKIVDFHNAEWLEKLKNDFEDGTYYPTSMEIIEVPKGNGLIRPGSLLLLEDNIFYAALVQECYPHIIKKIEWAQNTVDFSNIPNRPRDQNSELFGDKFEAWKQFREKTLSLLHREYRYVIVTDITGFFENIDLSILLSELKACDVETFVIENLRRCLNRWSQLPGRGIPQGNSSSDLLAKLYLNNVDQGMANEGFCFIRYVDDIRIFCKTETEAKNALKELTRLLRRRGLNLQSAKTKILSAETLVKEIETTQKVINDLKLEFKSEMVEYMNMLNSYGFIDEQDFFVNDETPVEVFRKAMKLHFIEAEKADFNKTLFHFLINKLTKFKELFAIDYFLSLLENHPEETTYILKYFSSADPRNVFGQPLVDITESLLKFIESDLAVYDYQNFQILCWLREYSEFCLDHLLRVSRVIGFDNNKPYYYRSVARDILGQFGNSADLEKLEEHVSYIRSELEKAELICCLKRVEKSRRNSFYQRVANGGDIVKMAVNFSKSAI